MKRYAYFDNAKLILIFLVVFGHMIQPFIDASHEINTLYLWIYTFHMPAFIFLAGFFAKGSGNKEYIVNLAKKLLIPYIIFQLLYTGYYFFIGKENWQVGMFYPHWSLWFLFSLFCWHILLSWFKKIPAALGVTLAVLLGLLVGYFGEIGHTFSLSRTFVFFPFFLIGYWLTKDHVMFLKRKSVKIASLVVLVIVAAAIYIAPDLNSGWLLASKSYGDLGMPEYGGLARLLVYATSVIMAMSILAWVPQKNGWLTFLGTRTLYVYLLHGFFIQYFRQAELFKVDNMLDLLGLSVIAAAIVLLLSSKPMLSVWQPFIEGKASMIKNLVSPKNDEKNKTQSES
ncbi:acyltransferase family protein [Virgibacillus alimentarius]|uniref:Fucose 4-O-acetylase-like acetyltransferase n=1 Tax=Virgibacillus alimentarius TaxID=698769 RepID=A0ABS4SC35_9BACI|nr:MULTISPECIES: acyltransferase family protein [Virgibacillus]MBP2257962.1 fucose 4-O-acetylase-like acetyltransferase [Virgibacillus alimentarius]HLR67289.1 acyltransferase family protein [Virgibacillus sp.]